VGCARAAWILAAAMTTLDKGLGMTHEHANLPDEPEMSHPLLSHVIECNIRPIILLFAIPSLSYSASHKRVSGGNADKIYCACAVQSVILTWAVSSHILWSY